MKRSLQTITVVFLVFVAVLFSLAQMQDAESRARKHYEEISKLPTISERQAYHGKLSTEERVELWKEHFRVKLAKWNLNEEQLRAVNNIRALMTAEQREKGGKPGFKDTTEGKEMQRLLDEASKILTKEQMRSLFYILGDDETFDPTRR